MVVPLGLWPCVWQTLKLWGIFIVLLLIYLLIIWACGWGAHIPWHMCRSQRINSRSQFSSSTIWVTGIKHQAWVKVPLTHWAISLAQVCLLRARIILCWSLILQLLVAIWNLICINCYILCFRTKPLIQGVPQVRLTKDLLMLFKPFSSFLRTLWQFSLWGWLEQSVL